MPSSELQAERAAFFREHQFHLNEHQETNYDIRTWVFGRCFIENEVSQSFKEKTQYFSHDKIQFFKEILEFQRASQCLMTHDQIGGGCDECDFFFNIV